MHKLAILTLSFYSIAIIINRQNTGVRYIQVTKVIKNHFEFILIELLRITFNTINQIYCEKFTLPREKTKEQILNIRLGI